MTVQIDVQYRARPRSPFSDKDAQIIGPELERIVEQTGTLDTRTIVRLARPVGSPLHKYIFKVPPGEAAERYYRDQARLMTRSIVIMMPTSKGETEVRAFYSVALTEDNEHDREYMPLRDVITEPDLLRRQKFRFRRDIERLKEEYDIFRQVAEFEATAGPVLTAIDKTLNEVA